jgi:hypothetical protein
VIVKKCNRVHHAEYVYGIVTDQHSGAKGEQRVGYDFYADDVKYYNTMPKEFFKYCQYSCCKIGDTVIVRYRKGNPNNNDVVSKMPNGSRIKKGSPVSQ